MEWSESMQNFAIKNFVELDPELRKWVTSTPAPSTFTASLTAEKRSIHFGVGLPELTVECSNTMVGVAVNWNEPIDTAGAYTTVTTADSMHMFVTSRTSSSPIPVPMTTSVINSILENEFLTASTLNTAGEKIVSYFDIRGFAKTYTDIQAVCN